MTIAFNQIPGSSLRLSGVFIEFSGAPSSNVGFQGAGLVMGQSSPVALWRLGR